MNEPDNIAIGQQPRAFGQRSKKTQNVWLIERRDQRILYWLCEFDSDFDWTPSVADAIKFSDQDSAIAVDTAAQLKHKVSETFVVQHSLSLGS